MMQYGKVLEIIHQATPCETGTTSIFLLGKKLNLQRFIDIRQGSNPHGGLSSIFNIVSFDGNYILLGGMADDAQESHLDRYIAGGDLEVYRSQRSIKSISIYFHLFSFLIISL